MLQTRPHKSITNVRWMIRRDMDDVLRIERKSFAKPWDDEDFFAELRRQDTIGVAAEHGDRVVGFMIYQLTSDELGLVTLAVDPEYRRKGIGTQLLHKLVTKLRTHGRRKITTLVPERNLPAQLFLRRAGWVATEVVPGSSDSLYRMEYRSPENQELSEW